MKIAYILRGIPGSGKSTFAQTLGCRVLETDDHFIVNGEYVFNPLKLAEYHQLTLANFMGHLQTGEDICVANTFTKRWEYICYLQAARMMNYKVAIHEFVPMNYHEIEKCIERNIHNVPVSVILQMWYDFEPSNQT